MPYYAFTNASFEKFLAGNSFDINRYPAIPYVDCYLNENLVIQHFDEDEDNYDCRVKCVDENNKITTLLEGCASDDICSQLKKFSASKLVLRYSLAQLDNYGRAMLFESPMKIVILDTDNVNSAWKPIDCSLYKYFKRKIGICGGASTGKSILGKNLSTVLDIDFGAKSFHVTEYATTFLQKYNRTPTIIDQIFIYFSQLKREIDCGKSDIVVSDCPVFLSYLYTKLLCKEMNEQNAFILSKMYKRVLRDVMDYADIIYMSKVTYKENGIRCYDDNHSCIIGDMTKEFLVSHSIPFIERDSSVDVNQLCKDLFKLN